jgi:hypothetical protein
VRKAKRFAAASVSNRNARTLFAIEFFFIAVITFLSSGRCKRELARPNRAANQVIRRE